MSSAQPERVEGVVKMGLRKYLSEVLKVLRGGAPYSGENLEIEVVNVPTEEESPLYPTMTKEAEMSLNVYTERYKAKVCEEAGRIAKKKGRDYITREDLRSAIRRV